VHVHIQSYAFSSVLAFIINMYLEAMRSGKLVEKVATAREALKQCNMCPRYCNVNRFEKVFNYSSLSPSPLLSSPLLSSPLLSSPLLSSPLLLSLSSLLFSPSRLTVYYQPGVCMIGSKAIVASAFPHFGEEACLQGVNGSGVDKLKN
jgi:uncharacterized Fe-S radical SAM superfamily protein PflX